jgi:hypothetical protein
VLCCASAAAQGFSLKAVKHLVLDEADKLLDMDFEQEIDQILKVREAAAQCGSGGGVQQQGCSKVNVHCSRQQQGGSEHLLQVC